MAMMDKLKGMLGKNSDKANQAVDKASSYADEKTGGKYSDKINKGSEKARNYVDGQGQQGEGGQSGQGGQGDGGQQQQ